MTFYLKNSFAANTAVSSEDVYAMKHLLNRLGYYTPSQDSGITPVPDRAVFSALKKFQHHQNLNGTGEAKPNDKTMAALNNEQPKGLYKWCTVGDNKVRDSHAAREGEIFDWNNPPEGGHPGSEPNCRCWAQPWEEGLSQILLTKINQSQKKWGHKDFWNHFKKGGGRKVTLEEIGFLEVIIEMTSQIVYPKLEQQVAALIKRKGPGAFKYDTHKSYDEFGSIQYEFGGSTINSFTQGNVVLENGILKVEAKVHYQYWDLFTDPANIRELIYGTSSPEGISIGQMQRTELGGNSYPIVGEWQTRLHGTVLPK